MSSPLLEFLPLAEVATAALRDAGKLREDCIRRLLIRHKKADPSAGERLVYRLSPILAGYLYRFNVPPDDREDLLQECWLRIHCACPGYREAEPVLPWVFSVVRHTQMDAYRRRRRRQAREVTIPTISDRSLVAETATMDSNTVRLLDRLQKDQREVLLMMKVEGLTVREIAAQLCCSEGAVKQKAHRAYLKLRLLLTR